MAHSTRSGSMRSEREYEPIAIEFEQLHRPRSSSFAQSRGETDDSNIDHETKPILDIHIDTGFDIPLITQVQHFETANGTSGRASPACTEDTEEALIERGRVPIRQASEEESSKVSAASRKRKSLRKGWRAGIVAAGILTMLVLLLNSILTIWASLKFDLKDGIGDLIMHDCSAIDSWSIALHALINAFGTAILSASNYAMQCLTAPTRKECDIAHARGDWLDIGVPSVRNVSRIQWSRRIVWALLALSGIPLHLLYNSAVFKELDDTRHNKAVLVSHQFLETEDIDFSIFKDVLATLSERAPNGTQEEIDGALYAELKLQWYIEPLVSHLHAAYRAEPSLFDRLNPRECIDLYAGPTLTGHSHLFAVVNAGTNLSDFTSPSPINDYSSKTLPDWTDLYLTEAEAEAIPSFWSLEYGVYHLRASGEVDPFLDGPPMPDYEYCLAKVMESQCKLQFSLPIMVTVIICMMIKSILMVWILWYHREETFVTFGDAIASWLDKPDASTKGDCLMRKTDAGPKKLEARVHGPGHSQLIARHGSGVRRCGVTIGIKRWLSTIAVYVVATAATAVALWQLSRITMFGQTILNGGFGTVNPNMKISTRMPTSGGLVAMVIIANSPHLLASLWYLLYNGLFTCMHLSLEYSGYAKERKSLRVTTPRGDQRSTYWLQLPYTYALPLMAAFAVLHWLVSQSVFLVRLVPVKDELVMGGSYSPPDPELVRSHLGFTTVNVPGHRKSADDDTSSDLGFSVAPIVAVMAVSFCMLLAVIAMGFRKLESSMPIAGSCSFALAAATHRPKEDVDASVLPVMWGEVPDMGSEDVGHCCFTSQEVVETVPERKYAGVSQDESVYMAGRGADRRENCMYSRE